MQRGVISRGGALIGYHNTVMKLAKVRLAAVVNRCTETWKRSLTFASPLAPALLSFSSSRISLVCAPLAEKKHIVAPIIIEPTNNCEQRAQRTEEGVREKKRGGVA